MQGGRGRDDPFFGSSDPFAGFGGMPSLFGGRDPFDDPFFTHPHGGMLQPSPFGPSRSPFMGVSPYGSRLFGPNGSPFMDAHEPIYHNHRQSMPNSSRGPIIQEPNSDDENEEPEGREVTQRQYGNEFSMMHDRHSRPQARSFSFQSSTVTYGGPNGAYYTSSTTRRAGSDGVIFEEHKEADSVTGQAAHRISRGIHDKGHSVSRHLKSDGHVDTKQVLHNINEDELNGFEEAWKGKTRNLLPSWNGGTSANHVGNEGSGEASRGGWALPSTDADADAGGGGRRRSGAAQSSKARKR